jgi:EAL domain-containing protein (putative c-di-GMP-specific phosphodiesterase class I)
MKVHVAGTKKIAPFAIAALAAIVSVASNTAGFVAAPLGLAALAALTASSARRNEDRDAITWNLLVGAIGLASVMAAAWGVAHSHPGAAWGVAVATSSMSLICFGWAGGRIARPLLAAQTVALPAFIALAGYGLIAIAWQWNAFITNRPDLRTGVQVLLIASSAALIITYALSGNVFQMIERPTERVIIGGAILYGVGSAIVSVVDGATAKSPSVIFISTLAGCAIVAYSATTPAMALVSRPLTNLSDRRLSPVAPSAIVATLVADGALVVAMTHWTPSLSVVFALVLIVIVQAALLGAAAAYALNASPAGSRSGHAQRRRVSAAVADGQIVGWFQPIVRSSDLQVVGFETLARWNDPRRGFVSANDFVDTADRAGLLATIDRSMIREAAAAHATLFACRSVTRPILTVNVHPRRLAEPGFALQLGADLTVRGLDGIGLMFEVTETAPIIDWAVVLDNVDLLRKMGMGLAIDDFGAGNANFNFLLRFEPDLVKLDRSLIEAAVASERSRAIVQCCVDAAHAAGAEVLAEGVSDLAWVPVLCGLGFEYFQGSAFGSAAPVADLVVSPLSISHPKAS